VKALLEKKIEVGFSRINFLQNKLRKYGVMYKELYKEPLIVALPERHPLSVFPSISIQQLVNESFIMLPRELSSTHYDLTLSVCTQAGFKPKVLYEATKTISIVSLVASGIGIAIIPTSMSNYQKTGVVYLPIIDSNVQLKTALIWLKDNKSKMLEKFLNFCDQLRNQKF